MKLYEIVELKEKQDKLEQKIMNDHNITIYTKYGLFRSQRYDGIYWDIRYTVKKNKNKNKSIL